MWSRKLASGKPSNDQIDLARYGKVYDGNMSYF